MKETKKYLIGGRRMVELGSDRTTVDTDYLVNIEGNDELFMVNVEKDVDLINASAHKFYSEIWEMVDEAGEATPQAMFEMKAFSLIQHLLNFKMAKAAATEYDMKRLAIDFGINSAPIAKKYMTTIEYKEVLNTINF